MDSAIAIKVENLSKTYTLRNPQVSEAGNTVYEYLALNNVSFEIRKGESVGIIGPNGSGKSTLLKILAGVTKPTSGKVSIRGKVASILDIGAGFHQDLSGRENVYLNGQIYGFSKKEMAQKYDVIVEFSGIDRFIDEPVKNYSNGMYLRLAFSIMVHLNFDVYLFDEAFNVGDAEFGLKTKAKFQELIQSNKTMVFVSHNMSELINQDNYIRLEKGIVKAKAKNKNLLSDYLENALKVQKIDVHTKEVTITDFSSYPISNEIRMMNLKFYQEGTTGKFKNNKPFILELEYEKLRDVNTIDVALTVFDLNGTGKLSSAPYIIGNCSDSQDSGKYLYRCVMTAPIFNSQVYRIRLCFFKNLGGDESLLENNASQVLYEKSIEITLILDNIITFKPLYNNNNLNFDLSTLDNYGGFLPDFKWQLLVKPNNLEQNG